MNATRRTHGSILADIGVIAFFLVAVSATAVLLAFPQKAQDIDIQTAAQHPLVASAVAISLLGILLLLSVWLYRRTNRLRTWSRIAAFVAFSLAYWSVVGWLVYAAAALLPGDISVLRPAVGTTGASGQELAMPWAIVALAIGMFIAGKLVWPTEKPVVEDDYGDIVSLMSGHVLVEIDAYAEAALDEIVDPGFINAHSVRFCGGHRAVVKAGIIARYLTDGQGAPEEAVLFRWIASNLLYRWFLRLGRTEDLGSDDDFILARTSCAEGVRRLNEVLDRRAASDARLARLLDTL